MNNRSRRACLLQVGRHVSRPGLKDGQEGGGQVALQVQDVGAALGAADLRDAEGLKLLGACHDPALHMQVKIPEVAKRMWQGPW